MGDDADFKTHAVLPDGADALAWFREQAALMRQDGATWFRMARHPTNPQFVMLEGWRVRPEDDGSLVFDVPE